MKQLILFCTLIAFSCGKNSAEISTTVPSCIQQIIDNNSESHSIQTIRVQKSGDRLHYWLNTDDRFLDGSESIINDNCDTICSLGGFLPPDCAKNYDDSWVVIWEK